MEQILNFIQDQELKALIIERANKLKELHQLELKGATGTFIEEQFIYTFIVKDLKPIAQGDCPSYKMRDQDQLDFRSRQNNRASRLYEFAYAISDEIPQNINLIDITNSIIQITFTLS